MGNSWKKKLCKFHHFKKFQFDGLRKPIESADGDDGHGNGLGCGAVEKWVAR